ncbi:hypothetical protein JKA73_01910 [Myxococcus xanthus]|uniref:hypothetical protein n=1 Tax=Myxococcus xanthus TaxID=34 RepID=UPI001917066E|nr:hypothetical protein [Myxococcus xanthus]QQR44929.1 hypothetical protein JKA73_01910 [Myxococcus xanthus]
MTWTLCITPSRFQPDQLSVREFSSIDGLMSEFFEDALDPTLRTEKDGHAVIPAKPLPPRADGLYEGKGGDPTPTPYRRNANFSHVALAVVDFDCEELAALDAWLASLRQRGLWFLAYPTHSYGHPIKPIRYRVVLPFSEPVAVGSPSRWADSLWPHLMDYLGLAAQATAALKADASCKDVARLYYLPSWNPANTTPRPTPEHHRGQPLDVEALFGPLLRQPFARYVERPGMQQVTGAASVDLQAIRKRLSRFKRKDYCQVIEQMDAGEVLMLDGQRHLAINRLTEMLARVAAPEESSESLLAIAQRSLDALGKLEPSRDVWGEALRGLDGARAKLQQWDLQQKANREAKDAKWRRTVLLAATSNHRTGSAS